MSDFIIGKSKIYISDIKSILIEEKKIVLHEQVRKRVLSSRKYLDDKLKKNDLPIYGVNTGFGSLCNVKVDDNQLSKLQKNIILSHACGTGEKVPAQIVKLMLLLKIQSLCLGFSSVQLKIIDRLILMFNNNILPIVYSQGSLGASGDLAPLAHLFLPLIGEGKVLYKDIEYDSKEILVKFKWDVIELKSKEGLALLNGTQFMQAYGVWSIIKSQKISYLSDMIASISLDAFNCRSECFDELLQFIRPHKGQIKTAKNIRDFIFESEIQKLPKMDVQDPYSFRCIPQVHGATKDVLQHVYEVFSIEINSVTDNPTVFEKEDKILSGGNFHGQPIAMAMDYLAIAISELASISERRVFHLISGKRDLPPFLVAKPGINSGFMIPQYTAASIVSQNKQLCTPSSVDSIVSSNGQEDHVSMGANCATKLLKVIDNTERVLAIEMFNASQAMFFKRAKSSDFIEDILSVFRNEVDFVEYDRALYKDIQKSVFFLQNLSIEDSLL